jgi:hypothetical protein
MPLGPVSERRLPVGGGDDLVAEVALDHGSVATREYPPPEPFRELTAVIRDAMGDGREPPERLYVERRGTDHEVRYRSADAVFYSR